jgi:hypothetical protein
MLGLGLGALAHANWHANYHSFENDWWSELSVLQAAHAAEILIKARIAQQHPLLIFEHLPKPPAVKTRLSLEHLLEQGRTYQYSELPDRLWAATGIMIPNREIASTLRDTSRDFFFFLNNGITIVCDKYLYQSGGFPVTLHRPQIVNGRQTAETVFSVFREGDSQIGNVTVFVRVIETSKPSLIEEISVATNSQSRIGARDLRANHSIARKLGAGLHRLGYHYVRKRGEVSTLSPEKTIDALKAGQLILAYLKGLPEKAKTDTTSMFAESFEDVFDPSFVTLELLVTAHQIFSDIEQEKHRAMITMRKSGLSAASVEHWVVEGSFHVLYCVGLFAKKRQLELAHYEICAPLVPEAMSVVGRYYENIDRIAAYRLFRSVRTRDDLRQIIEGEVDVSAVQSKQFRFEFSSPPETLSLDDLHLP